MYYPGGNEGEDDEHSPLHPTAAYPPAQSSGPPPLVQAYVVRPRAGPQNATGGQRLISGAGPLRGGERQEEEDEDEEMSPLHGNGRA